MNELVDGLGIQGIFLGLIIGFLAEHWRRWLQARGVSHRNFFDLLDVSLTSFEGGKMCIRTQIEEPLSELLSGESRAALVRAVMKGADETDYANVILTREDLGIPKSKLILETLRNQVYGRTVNLMEYYSRRDRGETYEMVSYVGALTCEPQFDFEPATKTLWVADRKKEKGEKTKRKIRLLLFPRKAIDELLLWCEQQDGHIDRILKELCEEKHVRFEGQGGEGITLAGQGRIDDLIKDFGELPRPIDRKRYVAMAQMARHVRANGGKRPEDYLEFEIPVVSRKKERLIQKGGVFTPANPKAIEAASHASLSNERRRFSEGESGLYYLGRNGTVTSLVTNGGFLLLLRKELNGVVYRALPGGFLELGPMGKPRPLRSELLRELTEEALEITPGSDVYRKVEEQVANASLLYVGPVEDVRDDDHAIIQDHVYHLDISGLDVPLRKEGIHDVDEKVWHAQWFRFDQLEDDHHPFFASHGLMIETWMNRRNGLG